MAGRHRCRAQDPGQLHREDREARAANDRSVAGRAGARGDDRWPLRAATALPRPLPRRKYVQHRTDAEHVCDEHSARRKCAKVISRRPRAHCRWCERPADPIDACRWRRAASGSCTRSSVARSCAPCGGGGSRSARSSRPSRLRPATEPESANARPRRRAAHRGVEGPRLGCVGLVCDDHGARRGEICGLRWSQLDLDAGVAVFQASIGQIAGERWEKDTKTHQHRRVTLDAETRRGVARASRPL